MLFLEKLYSNCEQYFKMAYSGHIRFMWKPRVVKFTQKMFYSINADLPHNVLFMKMYDEHFDIKSRSVTR